MPTADQRETTIQALGAAATAAAVQGSTLNGQQMTSVTATSTRQYLTVAYSGEGACGRLKRDFERNSPEVMPGGGTRCDGVVLVYDGPDEVIVIARVRK